MALDPSYKFPVTIAVKVIMRNRDKILLTNEPAKASWMPGRWGLPGGKVLLNESLNQALERKINEETGMKCTIRCLYRIVEILMPEKNAYHFVYAADYMGADKTGTEKFTDELKWITRDDWKKITEDDLTEYYLKGLLEDFWEKPFGMTETNLVIEQRTFEDKKVQEWMSKGTVRE